MKTIKELEKIVAELEDQMNKQIEANGSYSQNTYDDWNYWAGVLHYADKNLRGEN